jgi:hypothetical protein
MRVLLKYLREIGGAMQSSSEVIRSLTRDSNRYGKEK